MAVSATLQTLVDGERNLIVKATFNGDGTDASSVLLIDASTYAHYVSAGAFLKLQKIKWSIGDFDITLEWDASSNVKILTLGASTSGVMDFSDVGGIPNNAGSGITGDVDFSSAGNASGDHAFAILWFVKEQV